MARTLIQKHETKRRVSEIPDSCALTCARPLSSPVVGQHGTYKTVKPRFWPRLSGKSPSKRSSCSLFDRKRDGKPLEGVSVTRWMRGCGFGLRSGVCGWGEALSVMEKKIGGSTREQSWRQTPPREYVRQMATNQRRGGFGCSVYLTLSLSSVW